MRKTLTMLGALLVIVFSLSISSAQAVLDTSSPTTPSNLTAVVISSSQINLSWTASTDNVGVSGYAVFKNDSKIADVMGTTYNNTALASSTTYTYAIRAYDAAGNISDYSSSVSATTLASSTDATAPSAPTNLLANVISSSQINLSWTTSTDNIAVTGYSIFRNNAKIADVTGASYNNMGLTTSTTYSYVVKAYDAAGNLSMASNTVTATTLSNSTDSIAPSAPSNLRARVVSFRHVNLKWSASSDNTKVVGYVVFRDGIEIATVKNNHYNNIGLTASTTYAYLVKAVDAAGNRSVASNTITVTTLSRNNHDDGDDDDDHDNWQERKHNIISKIEKYKHKISEKIEKIKSKKQDKKD